ncbi:hypothetical protein EDD16DRAFT_1527072 [Pisolithus croceorrhizus]|nr:hypothetical protein EDD16DRAFT_1527072 [Pisolithus croceorrhizus]KAI6148229.1 hypothetical protein EDD17DRAFT_1514231 [Pisolithus thermaeus]
MSIEIIVQQSQDPGTEAKDICLFMLSELCSTEWKSTFPGDICAIKSQLREAQCHDALTKLQNYLHTCAHFIKHRNANIWGQRVNTHAKTLIDNLSLKINRVMQRYQVAHAVLFMLPGMGPWEQELQPLQLEDICGPTASGNIDGPSAIIGTNRHQVSNSQCEALRCGGMVTSGEEGMIDEWAKAHACAVCWSEEVQLLQEEMQHTKHFLKYKAKWWEQHRELPSNVSIDSYVREGISAYANQQATLQHKLSNHFSTLWCQVGHIQPEAAADEDNGPTYTSGIDDDPNSSTYGGDVDDEYECAVKVEDDNV